MADEVRTLAKQAAAKGTAGAAQRFLEALKERRASLASSANEAPPIYDTKKDSILRLNMTPEEKRAAIEARKQAEKIIIEEDSRVVNADAEVRFIDQGNDALVEMNNVLARHSRPGLAELHYEDCGEGERRIPKLVFRLDKATATPVELDVFYGYSRQLSIQAIQRLNTAASKEFELLTNREVRQMMIPPTELWTPVLVSLLSGPSMPTQLGEAVEASSAGTHEPTITEEEFRSWPATNELRGVIAAPYLIRYLILAIRAVVVAITNALGKPIGTEAIKTQAKNALISAQNAFNEIETKRVSSIHKAISTCLPRMFTGLCTAEDVPKGLVVPKKIPTFWEAYGTWKEPAELSGDVDANAYAALPEEERDSLNAKIGPAVLRRAAIVHFARELQHHAGQTSALLCTTLMQFLSIPANLILMYGQAAVRLPKRPESDRLRANSGIDHDWGYENLVDHVRIMQSRPGMARRVEAAGYGLNDLLDQLRADRRLINGTDPEAPREQATSGGALSLAYAYYSAVLSGIFDPFRKEVSEEEEKERQQTEQH